MIDDLIVERLGRRSVWRRTRRTLYPGAGIPQYALYSSTRDNNAYCHLVELGTKRRVYLRNRKLCSVSSVSFQPLFSFSSPLVRWIEANLNGANFEDLFSHFAPSYFRSYKGPKYCTRDKGLKNTKQTDNFFMRFNTFFCLDLVFRYSYFLFNSAHKK